jgi:hypothetical protein
VGVAECISVVSPRVTPKMNNGLICEFVRKEVDTALSQMQPLKAPSLDGYAVCFFQKH